MSNVPAVPLGEKRTVRIQWAPSAAPRIRKELVEDLLAREVSPQVIDEAEIVVSELVANAIRHAKPLSDGAIRIHWKVKNNVVEVEVSDGGGPTAPRPAPPTRTGRRRCPRCPARARRWCPGCPPTTRRTAVSCRTRRAR